MIANQNFSQNFKELLKKLEFKTDDSNPNILARKFVEGFFLKVDFENEQLTYPEEAGLKINERQTCNFSSPENFVVFECVHRLLEKGYEPKSLEIEPRWKVGRGPSGGRADILVRDKEGSSLLIIECKTAGEEFRREQKKMFNHGGQLFSYWQQERSTQYLCLYSSIFEQEKLSYQSAIVKIKDRDEDIDAFKKGNDTIKLFKNADNYQELFEVWKETFNLYFHYNGIFEEDVNAYEIELKPLKKKDLRPLAEAGVVFNTFMEILRHNNISDNANAFNRILSLLLCKIVDEEKGNEQVLDFQIKEGEDNPEKIQDRLQRLYAEGMKEYLGQEIVYYEDEALKKIIQLYPRQTPIEKVEKMFKEIKYYTHNEFALKEVHNKELFEENARVLGEVVKMLQNYRFRYNKKQQILGDFFELLLSHGIKQSEGQFFTPIPIVRFIILSLGLNDIIQEKLKKNQKQFLPKILDYACGAGHFLTESIEELQGYVENLSAEDFSNKKQEKIKANIKKYQKSVEWARDYIFGIEKDYRLARTSQIACFLNGDGDANIIYGDGLENHERLRLNKKFDVVISNPPYAIKSFKNYLQIDGEDYTLFKHLTESTGAIETLFLERTAQVLVEGGRAGIILPSSILSGGDVYEKTREVLLEHFEIKSIAEFGNKTFGATGTNTVILFLKRKSDDFKKDRKYIAEDLFNGVKRKRKLEHIDSQSLLENFIRYRQIDIESYRTLLERNANADIQKTELWKDYQRWFEGLTETKNLKKKKSFLQLSKKEQEKELIKTFYEKVLKKEQEKFYFYMLSLNDKHQPQKVIIAKSGEKEREKAFLGYEFSNRKGNEGIKIFRDEKAKPTTKMYDDENYQNPQKVSSYILANFQGDWVDEVHEKLSECLQIASLTDMIGFDRVEFNKMISLSPQKRAEIQTKWDVVDINNICELGRGRVISKEEIGKTPGDYPVYSSQTTNNGILGYLGTNDFEGEYVTWTTDGIYAGTCFYRAGKFNCTNVCGTLKAKNKKIKMKYLSFVLNKYTKPHVVKVANPKLMNNVMAKIKIPLPPLDVQQRIVAECEAVDGEVDGAERDIGSFRGEIAEKVQAVINGGYEMKRLGEVINTQYGYTSKAKNSGSIRYLRITDITEEGKLKDRDKKYINSNKEVEEEFLLNEKDIVVARSGSVGRMFLYKNIKEKMIFASYLIRLRTNNKALPEYIFAYYNTDYYWQQVDKLKTTLAQPNLNAEKIKQITIPIPPLNIQQKLVDEINQLEQAINTAQQIIDTAQKKKNLILEKHL